MKKDFDLHRIRKVMEDAGNVVTGIHYHYTPPPEGDSSRFCNYDEELRVSFYSADDSFKEVRVIILNVSEKEYPSIIGLSLEMWEKFGFHSKWDTQEEKQYSAKLKEEYRDPSFYPDPRP